MLREDNLFGHVDKVETAVARLKEFASPEGYYVTFSGGKDSVCVMALVKMAGVKYEAHFHNTTVEAPEVVRFVMKHHPDVIFDHPKYSMRQLIIKKGFPPTRLARYCCEYLKEGREKGWHDTGGRLMVTGIRWAESSRRSNRKMVEVCFKKPGVRYFHPIIDWSDEDVWQFIREYKIPYVDLYDRGFKRVGCIGCPLSNNQERELDAYPHYRKMYRAAFAEMLKAREERGKENKLWKNVDEVWDWWLRKTPKKDDTMWEIFEDGGDS